MDFAPVIYGILMIIFTVTLLRLGKIASRPARTTPRRPRKTYRQI